MTIELPRQKRGGASRPKDNVTIPPFGSAACAARLLLVLSRGSASVLGALIRPLARLSFCKCYRITKTKARRHKPKKQKRGGTNQKTEARRRKPPERQCYYSTIWFGRLRGSASVHRAFVIPASEPVSRNSGAIHRTLQIRHDPASNAGLNELDAGLNPA